MCAKYYSDVCLCYYSHDLKDHKISLFTIQTSHNYKNFVVRRYLCEDIFNDLVVH